MWLNLFIFVVSVAISIILRPKPPEGPNPNLSDLQIPTAEAGKPIPVVFGTVLITGPNVVWYGDLDYQAVKSKGGK